MNAGRQSPAQESPYPIVANVCTLKKNASEKAIKADADSRASNASGPRAK